MPRTDSAPIRTCSRRDLELIDAYWRAANYLSVGQIYLLDNPLLREPLRAEHVKPRLLGHWGTTPGLNLLYVHMNRVIKQRDLFNCYEAFIHIVDSMFNQHAKWLKTTRHIPWRAPIASLNYLLSSHVWRQDHNGLSHQDPGFIDHVVNKKAEVVRVYLPPDTNTLLSVADHCLRSRHYVNVIIAGKQPALTYLRMDEAIAHCTRGLGIWPWAGNTDGEPDVVLACAGDIPTLETLAAADLLRTHLPELKIRVVNVVDLMRLEPDTEHPHGLSDRDFNALFTTDKPVIFAYHGYPWLIHRLTYRRNNHRNLHVRGYKEEGTTTTPFDMVMLNDLDRFHLVMDVIDRVPSLGSHAATLRQQMADARIAARAYTREHGEDDPTITGWTWPHQEATERD